MLPILFMPSGQQIFQCSLERSTDQLTHIITTPASFQLFPYLAFYITLPYRNGTGNWNQSWLNIFSSLFILSCYQPSVVYRISVFQPGIILCMRPANGRWRMHKMIPISTHKKHHANMVYTTNAEMTWWNEEPGGNLNIRTLSYQYGNSHYRAKMASQPSYLYNRNPHTWKYGLDIETMPRVPADHFVNVPSQWETTLHFNIVSHWLGAYKNGSLGT